MIRFPDSLMQSIAAKRIIAVVTVEEPETAVRLATVLLENGIPAIELTLRTPGAMACLEAVSTRVPGLIAGAGTVITPEQVRAVRDRGARFAVSPGCNPEVLKAARAEGLPFAPGICTPSDIEQAVAHGANVLKYFPAESSGGLPHLRSMAAPYRHLNLCYIPLGGLKEANFRPYLEDDFCLAVGGSWIAPPEAIRNGDWQSIRSACIAAASPSPENVATK